MKIDGHGASRPLLAAGMDARLWRARADLGMYLVVDSPNSNRLGLQAAELVAAEIESVIEVSTAARSGDGGSSREELRSRAKGALESANRVLYEAAMERDDAGDVVTVSAMLLLIEEDYVTLAHVGNCRMYLYRRGELAQLSREHTRAPTRDHTVQVLQRGMGLQAVVELDELVLDLAVGDFLLVASHPVYKMFDSDDDALANRLSGVGPRETVHLANQLVQAVDQSGDGGDATSSVGATCVLLHGYRSRFARARTRRAATSLRAALMRCARYLCFVISASRSWFRCSTP